MSRSKKKIAAGTCVGVKSQKRGKQMCNRKFRAMERDAISNGNEPPYNLNQAIGEWDLGGDGKMIYGFGEKYELFKRK